MATFCIPKEFVQKLKNSALKGEFKMSELYEMTSAQRRDFFAKYTDKELGRFLNVEFEKAMVAKQQDAFVDFAKSIFSPKEQKAPVFQNIMDKIKALDELGVLDPRTQDAFLEDLVSDKLGATVTPEEIEVIAEKAKVIEEAQEKVGKNLGNPAYMAENLAFFEAKKSMDDYLQSVVPASQLKVLTGTVGRGMMLASIKSPVLNIGSNLELAFTEAISRRISSGQLVGGNNKLAIDFMKMANKIYQATGYDISRMTSISDSGASGGRVLGDTVHSQGKGAIRRIGRIVEDVVFKQLMGAPDVAFSSAHFADSVNINANKMAKGDKSLATKYMEDAMRLEPETAEGEILRNQAILDAQHATWTNTSWATKTAEGIRKIVNDLSGDLRIGDYLFPFVKTPANVIATGMDYAGLGIVKALGKTANAIRTGDLGSKEYFQNITRDLVRSGLGLTAAFLISMNLDDDDFVGAYDPARAQIEQLRNSNYNAIRVGNRWISTDWLGPLAVPVTAMMYARKYGDTVPESTFQYMRSVLGSVKDLPGISDIYEYVKGNAYKQNQSLDEMTGETLDYFSSEAYTRLVPSFFSDIAKAIDPYDRKTGTGLASIKSKIPGLRMTLPIKTNVLGEKLKGEKAWSDILFGARVKTDRENPIIKELNEIAISNDKGITFTDWDKSTSKELAQFKEKMGQARFDRAKIEYGQKLNELLRTAFSSPKYKNLSDADKLVVINDLDAKAKDAIFKKYGFTYKRAPAKKKPKI